MTDTRPRRLVRLAARRRTTGRATFNDWVRVESSGWYIQVSDFLDEPAAAQLLGEDTAWYFAVADWWRRRPPAWLRAERHAWRAEERQLAARAATLVQETTHLRTLRPLTDAAG